MAEVPSDEVVDAAKELAELDDLVRTLRARCPWDMRQTHSSLAPHLLEETYEALDAIDDLGRAEPSVSDEVVSHLQEELGDVLFQVFFHSVLAEEEGRFTLAEVARAIREKLIRRHPHVFADVVVDTAEEVAARWEVLKRSEGGREGIAAGVPDSLPSLALAAKLLRKADSAGTDLPSVAERHAELTELAEALERTKVPVEAAKAGQAGEVAESSSKAEIAGELLLCVADLVRRAGADPETALRSEVRRFRGLLEAGQAQSEA